MTSTQIAQPSHSMIGSLNPALRDFWTTQADTKVLKGGRDASKTYDAAGFAVYLANSFRLRFLCMRQFQNRISESVYRTIEEQACRFGLHDQFEFLKTTIRHRHTGAEFFFYGIHRHLNEIKGFHGADVGWMEEAEAFTLEQHRVIDPTLRKEGAELWLVYNPRLVSDYVETHFKHDPDNGVIVRHISYQENPYLSNTSKRKIARLKELDLDEYEHVYGGQPRTDDDTVIIKRSWIEASIDAHIKLGIEPSGKGRIGFDVADDGSDKNAQIYVKGIVAKWGENWKGGEDELLKSAKRVYGQALKYKAHVDYDSIGVGAHCGAKFQEMNDAREEEGILGKVTYSKFNAGAGVLDPKQPYVETDEETILNIDFFSNLKAQAWWLVRDRFLNTYNAVTKGYEFREEELISISSAMPNLADLVTQLSTPRQDFDLLGKVKVESKKDLAKRGVDSPNDADAFIMAFAPHKANVFGDLLKLSMGIK